MSDLVLYEKEGRLVTLTLNRPEIRNSVSALDMIQAIEDCALKIARDHEVSCVILTGADPAFCSGGDVKDMAKRAKEMQQWPAGTRHWYREGIQRIPLALDRLEVPLIGAINGAAIGAGCDLAMMCDIRIASEKAMFAESFVKLGIIPGDGGAWYLPRTVGRSKAFEMAFTGDMLDAQQALQFGLVSKVVPHEELLTAAKALAKRINFNPPEALRMTKRLLKESEFQRLDSSLEMAAAMQSLAQSTRDHEEAATAFAEKRKPVFKGQ